VGLVDGLGQYLDDQDLITWNAASAAATNGFAEQLPQTPDIAVAITTYGGPEADSKLGYDEPSVQVMVRGTTDPRVGRDLAARIYSQLHGLGQLQLPDGTWLVSCVGVQSGPVPLGVDGNNRYRFALNFRTEIRAVTAHRT
jgi:hypothetical protein